MVYRLAKAEGLTGFVANTVQGVEIEIEGQVQDLEWFVQQIRKSPPVRARITEIRIEQIPNKQDSDFRILKSASSNHRFTLISPDIATCDQCVNEFFNPEDRRFQYPFINCTDCGPRYTIIQDIPYDRPKTTMKSFTMCSSCQREYDDPTNRRFHAQPNACSVCGPKIWLTDASGKEMQDSDPIQFSIEFLKQGKIIAIKGLGGFHLACDAANDAAVRILRERKNREEKSLAVMVKDLKTAQMIAQITDMDESLLLSSERPIVLIEKMQPFPLSSEVAPNNQYIGVMLPYTPLHHLLMSGPFSALVMTSGNISEEPIVFDNENAMQRLNAIADYFLFHDRDIYIRNDDSVVSVIDSAPRFFRRSRGYAPMPVFIPKQNTNVLAVGGELKNTVALLNKDRVFLSHHIGDLENAETLTSFEQAILHLHKILDIKPDIIAHDLHPDYLSTQWALNQPVPKISIQHHHAHIVSCMAENGVAELVIGLALDGTGYGTDGHIWGGEVLVADYTSFERFAHFSYRPMPGGSQVIKEPWRMAMGYLFYSHKQDMNDVEKWVTQLSALPAFMKISLEKIMTIGKMLQHQIHCPMTSSLGRLFDAVSFLCGLCDRAAFEGQPAMLLEQAMKDTLSKESIYSNAFEFDLNQQPIQISPNRLIQCIMDDLHNQRPVSEISFAFHSTIVDLFVRLSQIIFEKTSIRIVALSGGCFQNRFLLSKISSTLCKQGFQVLTHQHVPCNDGGLSLGQAVIAANSTHK